MVTFLTLFLGLTLGPKRVELAVDPRVARVELRLDGAVVATLERAPWATVCEFGKALVPHRLEAIARDSAGREIGRAMQSVNMPRATAEVTLRLVGDAGGYHAAELTWKAVDEADPEEIRVSFDGEPLTVEGRRVRLPPHDPRGLHVLAAELIFPGAVQARADLAFGGEYGEEVSSELTAVPLELTGRKPPSIARAASWLRASGAAARVVAVDSGPRELVIIREDESLAQLRGMYARAVSQSRRFRQLPLHGLDAKIDAGDTLRFVKTRPTSVKTREGGVAVIFDVSQNMNNQRSGLSRRLTAVQFDDLGEERDRREELVEAMAVAALHAAGTNRARAVLLVRAAQSASAASETGLDATGVRQFLRELRVPFFVWRVGSATTTEPDPWDDESVRIRDWSAAEEAAGDLVGALRRQTVVWIAGLHLPAEVELTPAAPGGVRLAGTATR